jgi:putative restriction endonuclease
MGPPLVTWRRYDHDMRYWWVNQNQTYRHEVPGGYLWSPKRKTNGHRNPFYDFMREVAPGDIVFSFAAAQIKAIGVVASNAYESPKPMEFGQAGAYWDKIGWRVDVGFLELKGAIHPAQFMDQLAPKLPARYSPLRAGGTGLQSVYLTVLPESFATTLIDLIGREARDIVVGNRVADELELSPAVGLAQWEEHELAKVSSDYQIEETTREAIVLARRGQGLFKKNVMKIEKACRLTGVERTEHLRASHCKPWRDSDNRERLDGENGLLLTPDADHLFDRGFLSFGDDGEVLISPVAHVQSMRRMGLDPDSLKNVGIFSEGQRRYLEFHRCAVFLKASFSF